LQAGGVAAELLKTGIADGNGSPRPIKLELHGIVFMKLSLNRAKNRTILHRPDVTCLPASFSQRRVL
jgi:hypothetical protein